MPASQVNALQHAPPHIRVQLVPPHVIAALHDMPWLQLKTVVAALLASADWHEGMPEQSIWQYPDPLQMTPPVHELLLVQATAASAAPLEIGPPHEGLPLH